MPVSEATPSDSPPPVGTGAAPSDGTTHPELRMPEFCRRIDAAVPAVREGGARLRALADRLRDLDDEEFESVRSQMQKVAEGAAGEDASDLEMGGPATGGRVWYRVDGEKAPRKGFGQHDVGRLDVFLLGLIAPHQRENLLDEFSLDFSFSIELADQDRPQRFRGTMYLENGHLALNMRLIKNELRPLESLGFHPNIQQGMLFERVRSGLTLVTGVTGSGKSTTLDAVIDANNRTTPGHVVVIGEPIEYVHESQRCIVRHREVGKEVTSFAEGVVEAMRQDPDIVVIGEMRDQETISAAMEVADTGHRVFSTLHTSSAVESLDRIVAQYPPWEQERIRVRLADTLTCVISQKLCPRVGGGRILAKEVLWVTSSVRAAIKNGNTDEIYQMIWENSGDGQTTLEQDLHRLARSREISRETAFSYANNTRRLEHLIG